MYLIAVKKSSPKDDRAITLDTETLKMLGLAIERDLDVPAFCEALRQYACAMVRTGGHVEAKAHLDRALGLIVRTRWNRPKPVPTEMV